MKEIDDTLATLVGSVKGCADEILDLRDAAMKRQRPGLCVACYFKIAQAARNPALAEPLRSWIEENVEVVAEDDRDTLERLPVQLDGDDLEDFCRNVMQTFQTDRAYDTPHIRLHFDYKRSAAA